MSSGVRRAFGAVCACALGAGVLEALLLLGGFERRVELDPLTVAFAGGRIDGAVVHELDARQLWRPIAGAKTPWGHDELDPHGLRNAPLALARRAGVARIAALGDSTVFGRDVDARQCWIEVAAHTLVERGVPCEALNAGVIGFTVRQGRERYPLVVRPFAPDVVVLAFGAYEEHLPALGRSDDARIAGGGPQLEEGPFARLGREARIAQLARWIGAGFPARAEEGDPQTLELDGRADPAGAVDWPGERRVSVAEFAAHLRALAELVIADGARVVFVDPLRRPQFVTQAPILAQYSAETRKLAAELGAPLVDGRVVFGAALQAGATYPELFAGGAADPGVLGHARLGVAVADLVAPLVDARVGGGR